MLVRIPDVPVDLFFANAEQLVEAVAALSTVFGAHGDELPLTGEDVARTNEILRRYADQRQAAASQAGAARRRDEPTFVLELDFPPQAADDLDYLISLTDRIDDLCAEQDMAWPAPIAIRAFRRTTLRRLATAVREADSHN